MDFFLFHVKDSLKSSPSNLLFEIVVVLFVYSMNSLELLDQLKLKNLCFHLISSYSKWANLMK
jgi:hypothetical protein